MKEEFKILDSLGAELIAEAIGSSPSKFCDFTPFVILMWQKMYQTEYLLDGKTLYLKLFLDKRTHYGVFSENMTEAVYRLFEITGEKELSLSFVEEKALKDLEQAFEISECFTREEWADYIYLHDDLAEMKGRRYAGQRNHINKLRERFPDYCYERVTKENIDEVKGFFLSLTIDRSELSESALFETEMVERYLTRDYFFFKTEGGLIRAGGEIVSFAFGEICGDTLFVHVEKARRDVQGAYQAIAKEFASHNKATFINREEDMGIEGLRRSKESYHPIEKAKKYSINVKKL